jgi:DNA (cytosine-5)-methyltransferase 1
MQFELPIVPQTKSNWFKRICANLSVEFDSGWPDTFGKRIREYLLNNSHKPIKTLSLFSGGGGLDIGFHDCGFEIIEMVEIEENFCKTLSANVCNNKLISGSKVSCIDIREYVVNEEMHVDFIIGGPPCQTFSSAGRRASGVSGTDDPRGMLFMEYVRLLITLKPKGFLFENVYGIVGAQGGNAWEQIKDEFKKAGYTIFYKILDAADYGVPQHRERLFIVGLKNGDYRFPFPTHGPDSTDKSSYYPSGQAVVGVRVDTNKLSNGLGGKFGHLLNEIPPGLNYSFYTKEMGHPKPVFSWRSKFSDFLYKADPLTPVRTIKASGGAYTGPFSWENRKFTIDELKRLQTFPDDYEIVGNDAVKIKQIGNSVPPQIGRVLAISILDQVFGVALPDKVDYMPDGYELGFRKRKRGLTDVYRSKAQLHFSNNDYHLTSIDESLQYVRYLGEDFSWDSHPNSEFTSKVHVSNELNVNCWKIKISNNSKFNQQYKILIKPTSNVGWVIPSKKVELIGCSFDDHVYTALWKALEENLHKINGTTELVHLSGYYQYKPAIKVRAEFSSLPNNKWIALSNILNYKGVASNYTITELSNIWNIDEDSIFNILLNLKLTGYEIRNHKTNPQILDKNVLIPYIFPTLTPKSVQLFKSLE